MIRLGGCEGQGSSGVQSARCTASSVARALTVRAEVGAARGMIGGCYVYTAAASLSMVARLGGVNKARALLPT